MDKEARFKASVMTSTLDFVSRELGGPALQGILGSFDSSQIAGKKLLPSDWVLQKTYHDFLQATHRYLQSAAPPRNEEQFLFQMGKYIAQDSIAKYYKSLIRVLDTKFLLTQTPRIWGVIHTHGKIRVEPVGKTGAEIYITDFPSPSRQWCGMVIGFIHGVIELTRARDIKVEQVECVMNGAKHCHFHAEWR